VARHTLVAQFCRRKLSQRALKTLLFHNRRSAVSTKTFIAGVSGAPDKGKETPNALRNGLAGGLGHHVRGCLPSAAHGRMPPRSGGVADRSMEMVLRRVLGLLPGARGREARALIESFVPSLWTRACCAADSARPASPPSAAATSSSEAAREPRLGGAARAHQSAMGGGRHRNFQLLAIGVPATIATSSASRARVEPNLLPLPTRTLAKRKINDHRFARDYPLCHENSVLGPWLAVDMGTANVVASGLLWDE